MIALLNNKISQIDFEGQVQNFVKEVGELYWDLYFAYREYESESEVQNLAKQTWDETKARLEQGLEGGSAADEAQAADAFFDAQLRTETALSTIYLTETRLRRLIGLTGDEQWLLYPSDDPITEEIEMDRLSHLHEAFMNRLELKRQKLNIESMRMQWTAARSLLNPRADFVSGYKLNGFGKNLMSSTTNDGITPEGYNSAYAALFRGKQTTWQIGLEVNVPFYFRSELAQLRQIELRMIKAQMALADQEAEIAHELTYTFQSLQRWISAIDISRQRKEAAHRRTQASQADYDADRSRLDLLLRAQVNETQARSAYYRNLSEYNKTILDLHYRSGALLSKYSIQLKSAMPSPDLPDEE